MIPYGKQDINQDDIDAVIQVLRSDFLTQGPVVPAFEEAVSTYCKVKYGIAVSNATAALHIACLALDVGQGDIVWTSPNTFVASANCALYCGASVDFVDIDSKTYNLSVDRLAEKLSIAKKGGILPKVVIPVHLCGQSCDMEAIHELSKVYGFKIIEDASHAIGGKYKNQPIGNCKFSDITVFSFHPVKIITSGEGGMALTNDEYLAKKLRLLRSHGISNSKVDMEERPTEEIWNYQQIELGYNYRMTDIQAALGLSQLQRLDEFVAKRNVIAKNYDELLKGLPLVTPWQDPNGMSSFHLYVIRLNLSQINKTQKEVYEEMRNQGVLVNLHYIPVYRQPYFEKMGFDKGYCKEAEKYFTEAMSIPIFAKLTNIQMGQTINAIKSLMINF
ncbi:UDP-4-amino-4,6-dideoxy-N-acetyl-beta-L-altrosamine transaminase [Polynucleobacter rarus]|uniref:UDP-4-amino-4, 6-dideoxy-N-acetyl-beta-L-altrosamine transaminase n=1 Tax=Polynucleobacter rarus TaxID=556055 RepID=UPI001B883200|nr:UDP-4-amino-4,6-dideoxy-N-acetyl-beta-L-altrosamine transaminase [Polynucleobacter rarus]